MREIFVLPLSTWCAFVFGLFHHHPARGAFFVLVVRMVPSSIAALAEAFDLPVGFSMVNHQFVARVMKEPG
jgi:hypothetical protein